jgi:hypothetical protein
MRVGEFFGAGIEVMPIENGAEAVLERFEPANAGKARGLDLRYAVLRHRRGPCGGFGATHDWPPRGCTTEQLLTLEGFRYKPGTRIQVLVGVRASRRGTWFIPAFRLRYRVDGKLYATTYAQGIRVKVRD